MDRSASRIRHLIFLAHLWFCSPFLVIWLYNPEVRRGIPEEAARNIFAFIGFICLYLGVRTYFGFKHPKWLNWEYVFPPIDVAIVSALIYLGDRDPLSNISLLYLFPLAEAAGTLSVFWAATVALMVAAGVFAAADLRSVDHPFNVTFRYFFMVVLASLLTSLARAAAMLRAQLTVARDRNRIAMEMHDGVQGHLMTISSQLELAQHVVAQNPSRAAEIMSETKQFARLAADELRFLVHRMRSPSLSEGFLPALKQFAHNQAERNEMELTFEVLGEPHELPLEVEDALFRIAQEALTNVVRHARATLVSVKVSYDTHGVTLHIKDDGVGFEPSGEAERGGEHAGLESMASRAAKAGGTLSVESAPGQGTEIVTRIPKKVDRVVER